MSAFRDSSEIEFGTDDAYLLSHDSGDDMTLHHLKSRYGQLQNFDVQFDKPLATFSNVNEFGGPR